MQHIRSFFAFIHIDQLSLGWKIVFVLCILSSFLLAAIPLYYQFSFYFDTARDAYEAYSIWGQGNIKILGPGTDFVGVYHGVLWYYLLAVIYFIAQGNPLIVGYIYFIFLFLTIFLVGKVSYELFRDQKISFFSMLFYSFFPLYQAFTRWFSNPDLTLLIMPFLLFSLWRYVTKGGKLWMFWSALWMGIMVQSDFGFVLFYLLLPLYLLIKKKLPTTSEILYFFLGSFLSLSTFILAELKFDFRATKSLFAFILQPHTTSSSILTTLGAVVNKYVEALQLTLLPFSYWFVIGVVLLAGILLVKGKKISIHKKALIFLSFWLLNILMFRLFNTGLTNSTFIFAPSLLPLALFGGWALSSLTKKTQIQFIIFFVLIIAQLTTIFGWIKENKTTLSVQKGITFHEEKKIIEYTYTAVDKKPFAVATVTNPLFINTLWSYLYEFVGKKEYGYVPYFEGRSQEGYLGNMPKRDKDVEYYFLIFEPEAGIPSIYFAKARYTMDEFTDVVEERKFGNFLVQKRKFHPNKPKITVPDELKESHILYE